MYEDFFKWIDISIHTSAKEVTLSSASRQYQAANFNPHFREGSDLQVSKVPSSFQEISIHTSAKEVTVIVWTVPLLE